MSEGLSGRTLRKIPFLAHALFSQVQTTTLSVNLIVLPQAHTMTMEEYLDALEKAVKKQFSERENLYKETATEE